MRVATPSAKSGRTSPRTYAIIPRLRGRGVEAFNCRIFPIVPDSNFIKYISALLAARLKLTLALAVDRLGAACRALAHPPYRRGMKRELADNFYAWSTPVEGAITSRAGLPGHVSSAKNRRVDRRVKMPNSARAAPVDSAACLLNAAFVCSLPSALPLPVSHAPAFCLSRSRSDRAFRAGFTISVTISIQ